MADIAVMMLARAGVIEMRGSGDSLRWVRLHHVVTWQVVETEEEAFQVIKNLMAGKSQEIKEAWTEPFHARTWGKDRGIYIDADGLVRTHAEPIWPWS
jgi:hypothetical protein